jgi:CheY-like chemotaxis protein
MTPGLSGPPYDGGRAPLLAVLLAEDSDADALLLAEAIEDAGLPWSVERVHDGGPAIDRLRRGPPPALLVVDLAMPRVRGEDVLRAVQALEPGARPRTAVLSGSPNDADHTACLALGADRFAVKPTRPEGYLDLVVELARWLEDDG